MIDVKQAAMLATQFLTSLYSVNPPTTIQLEEVELSDDGKHWFITLSFPDSTPMIIPPRKNYKVFKIDSQTGQVQSMKIREVA